MKNLKRTNIIVLLLTIQGVLSFQLYAQNNFEFSLLEPTGPSIEWMHMFEDSLGDEIGNFPFRPEKYFILSQDIIQHSDGDIVFLNETSANPVGYNIVKMSPDVGIPKWIKILRQDNVGHRLGGSRLFETPSGNIEVLGNNYIAPLSIPTNLGTLHQVLHDQKTGEVIESSNPEQEEALLFPSVNYSIYPQYQGSEKSYLFTNSTLNRGFWVGNVFPGLEAAKVDTVLVKENFERDGIAISSTSSSPGKMIELPDGNFLFSFCSHNSILSNINSNVINLLVWITPSGELIKTIDITNEIGAATTIELIRDNSGILAYSNSSLVKIKPENRYTTNAVYLDYQGNILWEKEIAMTPGIQFHSKFIRKTDGSGFICLGKEPKEHQIEIFDVNLSGDFVKINELSSKVPHHKLTPQKLFVTNENDLIVFLKVSADTTIDGKDLVDTEDRAYALKISGEDLGLISSNNNLITSSKDIKVFPNPAKNQINISFEKTFDIKNGQIIMVNNLGQVVYKEDLKEQVMNLEIDVSQITSGVYYLQFWNEQELIETQNISVMKK